jgi:hypothetical protein
MMSGLFVRHYGSLRYTRSEPKGREGQGNRVKEVRDKRILIRRFLMHVLPAGFHRIRHYGLFANSHRAQNVARARQLLNVPAAHDGALKAVGQIGPADSHRVGGSIPVSVKIWMDALAASNGRCGPHSNPRGSIFEPSYLSEPSSKSRRMLCAILAEASASMLGHYEIGLVQAAELPGGQRYLAGSPTPKRTNKLRWCQISFRQHALGVGEC